MNDNPLSFDRCQFDGRRSRAVSAESRLSYSDYARMHQQRRSQFRGHFPLPAWILNDGMLRDVLRQKFWQYCKGGTKSRCPADLSLDDLQKMVNLHQQTKIAPQKQDSGVQQKRLVSAHVECSARHGGWLQTLGKLAWLYRLGWNSVSIGQEIGMNPQAVRVQLGRLNRIARGLFPDAAFPLNTRMATRLGHSKQNRPRAFRRALISHSERHQVGASSLDNEAERSLGGTRHQFKNFQSNMARAQMTCMNT